MSDLKTAIVDAKYVDMIELADFVVRDCGLPDMDESGEMLPQQNEIAASIFRWAAGVKLGHARPTAPRDTITHGRANGSVPGTGSLNGPARINPEDA